MRNNTKKKMRKLREMAGNLNILVSITSKCCSITDFARNITTRNSQTTQRRSRMPSRNSQEFIMKAVNIVKSRKSGKPTSSRTLYLLDAKAAKKFASLVVANRTSNSSHVVEINSGVGFLTKELLEAGIPRIHMFEDIEDFHSKLESLKKDYGDRVCLESVDFRYIWWLGYLDWKEGTAKLDQYFGNVEKRAWNEEPAIEIIGAVDDFKFFPRLIATIVRQNTLCKYGRVVLYLAIPPSVWAELTCDNEHYYLYRSRIIMFQTLFQYDLLGTLPRSVFLPSYKPINKKTRVRCRIKICQNDRSLMNIVKLEPRADIFNSEFTKKDLISFYYFVNHHLQSRKNRVIPALESWIPGCGRTLIAQGYDIFTEFGELSPREIFNLFEQFRSWPGFTKSSFTSYIESYLEKIDEQIMFETNADDKDTIFENSTSQIETSK